ncbi:MAG: flagellar biosynthetic protein FliR [Acetobacteraceae bacterium]
MNAGDASLLLATLPSSAFAFVLVLSRVSAAVMLLPGLGEADPPAIVRAGLAVALTVLILPAVSPLIPAVPNDWPTAAAMLGSEVITGLWLGWLARMLVLALAMAGQIIAYMLGLANVLQADVEMGAQETALGRLFTLAAPVVVLSSGLYALPVAALAGSYRLIAPAAMLPDGPATEGVVRAVAGGFGLALRLASPFVVASIVWHVAAGLVARLIPRVQVYFLALPGQILGGLVLLAMLSVALMQAWEQAVRSGFGSLPGLH